MDCGVVYQRCKGGVAQWRYTHARFAWLVAALKWSTTPHNPINYATRVLNTRSQDAYAVVVDIPALRGWSWFAVFDGHGGSKISQYW